MISSSLFAYTDIFDTDQSGYYLEAGYDITKPARFLNEFSVGYTFQNGLGVNLRFAYETYSLMPFIGPSFQLWNLHEGVEIVYPLLKQKERSMPISLFMSMAYDLNSFEMIFQAPENSDYSYAHSVSFGIGISRRIHLMKNLKFIPSLSVNVVNNTNIWADGTLRNYTVPAFWGQIALMGKILYTYADFGYEPTFGNVSMFSGSQFSTHLGIGFIIPNKKSKR